MQAPRCEVIDRISEWPYAHRCAYTAVTEILNSAWRERLGDVRLICEYHTAVLAETYPDCEVRTLGEL